MFGHPMPKADMAQLSKSLVEVVDTLRPSPEEQQRQKEAFQQVRSVLLRQWATAKVHLFGSTANCLSICNNNDIDVCLELSHDVQEQVITACPADARHDPTAVCICQASCTLLKQPGRAMSNNTAAVCGASIVVCKHQHVFASMGLVLAGPWSK